MGLDLVELVMSVEERFGITLSDADAERADTPAKLIDIVLEKVQAAGPTVCLTARAFYAIRRALMKEFGWHRSQIRPGARLEELVPRARRQAAWQRLASGFVADRWPDLRRPWWVKVPLSLLVCALLAGVLKLHFDGVSVWISGLFALLIWAGAILATKPFCLEFPEDRATVGQLAEFLVAFGPKLFGTENRSWTRPDVAAAIREITIEELGLKPGQYREDARFVQDLGGA